MHTPPYRPGLMLSSRLKTTLVALGVFILVLFVVDKLFLAPPSSESRADDLVAHLQRHEIRRATIAVRSITIELNDGRTLTERVPADRDIGPALKATGADIAITRPAANSEPEPVLASLFQFVPFLIMALLLVFILRTAARSRGSYR